MFKSELIAGFECAMVGTHDLLHSTNHVPERRMSDHFHIVREHGFVTVRDGLPAHGTHDVRSRMMVAQRSGMQVVWDMDHYWSIPDARAHGERVGMIANEIGERELWVCPVNEPSIVPMFQPGKTVADAVRFGHDVLDGLRSRHERVRVMTTDAIVHPIHGPWEGTDSLAERAQVIGVNIYPHNAQAAIWEVLVAAHLRYRKPVMISETCWHDGWHVFEGIHCKADWLHHVIEQADIAREHGADVVATCWYPIIHSPPWEDPSHPVRWSHGLLTGSGLDPSLASALIERIAA